MESESNNRKIWRRVKAWRDEFKFNYNEKADPILEMRRRRRAQMRHFKTIEAYNEYIRRTPPLKDLRVYLACEIEDEKLRKKQNGKHSAKPKVCKGRSGRRRAVATV